MLTVEMTLYSNNVNSCVCMSPRKTKIITIKKTDNGVFRFYEVFRCFNIDVYPESDKDPGVINVTSIAFKYQQTWQTGHVTS